MKRTAILNVVGLCPRLLDGRTPKLSAFANRKRLARVQPVLPAVTCAAQATYLTGALPSAHGIVGNGWYDREYAEHRFWHQSNHLVHGPKLWETLRQTHPGLTCAKLFWWYNMYSTADWSITPRPMYPADGRKVFDIYTHPRSIRDDLTRELGPFPFAAFWGPRAGIASSRWIAAAARWIENRHQPDLSLVYLPHLDYSLQRLGPDAPGITADLAAVDEVAGALIADLESNGVNVIVLSEHAITGVSRSIALNRLFRARGWLSVRNELGRELLDCGASRVFAIADHQVAHVYVNSPVLNGEVRALLAATPGIARVIGPDERAAAGLAHPRAGDFIAVAAEDAWFTYYYWEDDRRAPDFARCVDIHRKYGYDPAELFVDPAISLPMLRVAWKLLQKRLGMRMLMNLTPLDPGLVKGSHGAIPVDTRDWPLLIADLPDLPAQTVAARVHDLLLSAFAYVRACGE